MAIPIGTKANFETLGAAFDRDDVALLEGRRVSDGEIVALVCTVHMNDDEYILTPFAEMINGNPYEMYDPAAPGGGFATEETP